MSRAFKHVEWCLRKAEKEIEECKKIGKRLKHRGLVRVKSDFKVSKEHLEKAEHYLKVTDYLMEGNFSDISLSTLFYTMYQCFLAIASKFGYESGNQSCTISLIKFLKEEGRVDIDEKFLNYFEYENESIIDLREDYTYGIKKEADKSKVLFFINERKDLIDITKEVIYG
jgi:uncharacterized protein (UPF0332 family)